MNQSALKNCYVDEEKRGDARADLLGGCTSREEALFFVFARREGEERARGGKKE